MALIALRSRLATVFLLLLVIAPAYAEVHAPFYQATRNGQTIHILGTLHAGRADFYPFRPAIETAFKQSARLYLELDLSDEKIAQQMSREMICKTPCLKDALTEAEWSKLKERLGNSKAALQQLEKMRPWAAAVVLTLADFAAIGMQPDLGVEDQLTSMAAKTKPLEGLETAQEQISLFGGMPADEQKEMLVQWINMTPKERFDTSREMVAVWQGGNADALHDWYREVEKRYSTSPELDERFNQRFIVERNHRFVERLLQRIGQNRNHYFLAIGALHLGGPDGVLELLKKQGYKVEAK